MVSRTSWSHSETMPLAWILAFTATAVCMVKSDYVVMVRTHNFSNPGSLLANGDCCDTRGDGLCAVPGCDNYFQYCLRRNGRDENCRRSQINVNEQHLDFSEPTVLGLPNPVPLQGLTKEWRVNMGVRFHFVTYDADDQNNREIIGQVFHDVLLQVGEESDILTFSHQDPRKASVTLSFRVVCAENYYGTDCSQFCMCRNGQCVDGFDSFTCNCNPGFTGTECEVNINECIDPGVNCSGNGLCVDEFGSYSCNCSAGYNGTNCEINIDDCLPNPCGANGRCVDGIDSFTCICNTGYTGNLCESDIDECLSMSNPCGTNSQCENQEGTFSCSCNPDFTGERCQFNIDNCVGVNCSGNGDCLDGVNSFTCQCSPGHGGTLCAEELQSSGIGTGPIVGGVLGVLISLILILVIVIVVVLIMRCQNRQGKGTLQGRQTHSDALPGDNPVYDRGNTTGITLGGLTQTSAPVHYVNLSSTKRDNVAESAPERDFDNPIYGGNEEEETEDMYTDPDTNHQAGTGMGSSHYHEFDNPIYGGEAEESTYSMLAADSSTVNGTAAATGQTMYANTKRGAPVVNNEQVYDHVN